ncbi:TlpA disulfide reductase family protein [uncultured Psychroserpens sp.]|uniref:TlpA family protein disulfide reductase n=1 Tax=uncultured Psychroserpens sp. TaxID=255436 RepID=UPI0026316375|nr:TlpA disulfide reductase family protein [uncultured Psychroserpens sp.]
MKIRFTYLTIATLVLFTASTSYSQDLKNGIDVVKKVNEVFDKIKTISYTMTVEDNYGNIAKSENLQERTDIDNNNGFGYSKQKAIIQLTDKVKKTSTFSFSYDGNTLFVQPKQNGEITIIDDPTIESVIDLLSSSYLFIYRRPLLLKKGFIIHDDLSLLGLEKKDGQNCYKLIAKKTIASPLSGENKIYEYTWWINSKTFYPVAYESNLQKFSIKVNQVNQTLSNDSFTLVKHNKINYTTNENIENTGLLNIGEKFPAWYLKDASGNLRLSSEFKEKIVVIDFWGTWCPPCKKAMPDIQKLHDKYKNQDVVVIGISVNDKPNAAEKYFKSKDYTYLHLPYGEELAEQIKIKMYPTLYILNKKGNIIYAEKKYNENGLHDWSKVIDLTLK